MTPSCTRNRWRYYRLLTVGCAPSTDSTGPADRAQRGNIIVRKAQKTCKALRGYTSGANDGCCTVSIPINEDLQLHPARPLEARC